MPVFPLLLLVQIAVAPHSDEVRLRNIRQLTFGGQNAEAYFAHSGRRLIFIADWVEHP
ncbi:MAG: hypothetical protein ACREMJ_06495 [Gemmatimonadales bacterium]